MLGESLKNSSCLVNLKGTIMNGLLFNQTLVYVIMRPTVNVYKNKIEKFNFLFSGCGIWMCPCVTKTDPALTLMEENFPETRRSLLHVPVQVSFEIYWEKYIQQLVNTIANVSSIAWNCAVLNDVSIYTDSTW